MKVKHFILFFTFFSPYLFASSYRIVNVDYEIKAAHENMHWKERLI